MRVNVLCKIEMLKAYFCQQNEVNCVLNAFWKTLRMLLRQFRDRILQKSQKFNFSYFAFTQKCFQAIRLYNLKVGKNLYCILNRFFETNMGNPDFNFSTCIFLTKCHCTIMMWAKNMLNKNNYEGVTITVGI